MHISCLTIYRTTRFIALLLFISVCLTKIVHQHKNVGEHSLCIICVQFEQQESSLVTEFNVILLPLTFRRISLNQFNFITSMLNKHTQARASPAITKNFNQKIQ